MKPLRRIAIVAIGVAILGIGIWTLTPGQLDGTSSRGFPNWIYVLGIPVGIVVIVLAIREWIKEARQEPPN